MTKTSTPSVNQLNSVTTRPDLRAVRCPSINALIKGKLHHLDAVMGDQVCHMRTVLNVGTAINLINHIKDAGRFEEALTLIDAFERDALDSPDKATAYEALICDCCRWAGPRLTEIAELSYLITSDVAWVSTCFGIPAYFREKGHVPDKQYLQNRLGQLCLEEVVDTVALWARTAPTEKARSFHRTLLELIKISTKRLTGPNEKDIPALNFFAVTTALDHYSFMTSPMRGVYVLRQTIDDQERVTLASIVNVYFRHNHQTGKLEPIDKLSEEEQEYRPCTHDLGWSKYLVGQTGCGLHSTCDKEFKSALQERYEELMAIFRAKHLAYPASISQSEDDTRLMLAKLSGVGSDSSESAHRDDASVELKRPITPTMHPYKVDYTLQELFEASHVEEPFLGAGEHQPIEIVRERLIFKECTKRCAWNCYHIVGGTPQQALLWRELCERTHIDAGRPAYSVGVTSGTSVLPVESVREAQRLADVKEKKRRSAWNATMASRSTPCAPVLQVSWEKAVTA